MENNIIETMKGRGLMITEQRMWIIKAICQAESIVDIETFWINLRANRPISWATTYNTFRIMTKYGLLERKKEGRKFGSYRLAVADGMGAGSTFINDQQMI